MKRISIGLALLFAFCLAQAGNKSDPREQEIRKFFVEFDQNVVKRDEAAGNKVLHDEFTFVNPSGLVMNKERFMKFAYSGTTVCEEHKTEELSVRLFGDVAVCQYLLTFCVNMN